MRRQLAATLAFTLVATLPVVTIGTGAGAAAPAESYIVVLHAGADSHAVASEHARGHDAAVGFVYEHALRGYSARMSPRAAARVAADPRVAYVEREGSRRATHHRPGHDGGPGGGGDTTDPSQTLPTGVDRIDTDLNTRANIDGVHDPLDVDIAIIDTGMDEDHPDLNIAGGWNCVRLFEPGPGEEPCIAGFYEDGHGHGTHVAGTAAAVDNDIGVVGVAPGARLWAVGVLDDNGYGLDRWIIAGIDKVAANADTIEVANMSLGGTGYSQAMRDAITNAVDKGVVFVVAAGNGGDDLIGDDVYGDDGVLGTSDDFVPAAYPEVAAISALADSDGQPGSSGGSTGWGPDDSFAAFSNFSAQVVAGNPVSSPGNAIDLLMPGVSIKSTYRYGGYATSSGTSMASPHAAGLAALYIAEHGGRDADGNDVVDGADVALIRQALIDGAKAQDSPEGLTTLNDPDGAWEGIGWAGNGGTPPPPPPPPGDLTVSSISPDTIPSDGGGHGVTVSGTGIADGATLSLRNGSGPAPIVSTVSVAADGTSLDATITAKSGGPPRNRSWDVVVTNPDGTEAVLAGGLTVTP